MCGSAVVSTALVEELRHTGFVRVAGPFDRRVALRTPPMTDERVVAGEAHGWPTRAGTEPLQRLARPVNCQGF